MLPHPQVWGFALHRLLLSAACALALSIAATSLAQAGRAPSITQSLEMQTFSGAKISPDGRQVVYEESRTNWDANAFETDLWLADVATGERRLLTVAAKSSQNAQWSPDGRWIAFVSDRPGVLKDSPKDKPQLWVMPAGGGEAQQVTSFESGVNWFEWAPDSKSFGVAAAGPEAEALKARKTTFGELHVIHADYAMAHLWRVGLPAIDPAGRRTPAAAPKLLTSSDDYSVVAFAFSPDASQIAFSATRDPDLISNGTSKVYVLDLASGAVRLLAGDGGPNGFPEWSPDGKQIAFTTAAGQKYFFYANTRIAVVPAAGGAPKVIDPGLDENAQLLRWGPDGIYVSALQKTEGGLFRLDPATGAATRIALAGTPIARGFTLSADFKHAAYVGAATNGFPEIYEATLAGGTPVKLTNGGDQVRDFDTAVREVVSWKSGDGSVIEGVLIKPRDFDPKKKYPLLVVIHGGPTGIDVPTVDPDRYYPIERFVARGALVLRPNYRGSAGYGGKFRALNVRNLGVGDYADVISGVDSLIKQGFVDKDRVGAMGWSQGGYISAFITTSSDRFKAVSVGAGISDWMTYYANTDITPFTPQYLKATPWDDPAIYKLTSPIAYIAKAKTPTLIQHGGADRRVPIANAYELRQALEDHGVPVKMVVYDGFGHPINKPRQQRAVLEENENWFGHYIFGEPLAAGLTPDKAPPKAGAAQTNEP
jgi:dipeptidyl aminopeptidase/acylaminoacyl peptidase